MISPIKWFHCFVYISSSSSSVFNLQLQTLLPTTDHMDALSHHSSVLFWLITSLRAPPFTVCGLYGQQGETPHGVRWAADLISFIPQPNKSSPRPEQNVNSNPAVVSCVTVQTSVPGKNRDHSSGSKLTFHTLENWGSAKSLSGILNSDSSQVSVHCQIWTVGPEQSDSLIKSEEKKWPLSIISASLISSQRDSFPTRTPY